jgi:hypothetical protein
MNTRRLQRLTASALVSGLALAACVDTTPPWEKVNVTGTDGLADTGGAGGQAIDGPLAPDGSREAGVGGAIDLGGGGAGRAQDGAGGAIDAPWAMGGAIDAGLGGAGGGPGIDLPITGTGGTTVSIDGAPDVPLPGTGGVRGSGGASGTGGASGSGGSTHTGGTSGTGGTPSTGGTTRSGGTTTTGGTTGTGGTTTPDAGPDVQPDASPLLKGLVVYYPFESLNGTDLPDMSGNGHNGTLSIGVPPDGGTAPSGAGYELVASKAGLGQALAVHKTGLGYVQVPTAVFANATDMTIAVWVNITTSQNWPRILDVGVTPTAYQWGNTATGTKYLNMVPKTMGSNMLFSITKDGYNSEQTLSAPSLSTGVWKHLAVVLASVSGGTLYVDGGVANADTGLSLRAADLGAIDYAFIAKSRFDADPPFDGIVDELRVYNRALSATEVQALYQFTGP